MGCQTLQTSEGYTRLDRLTMLDVTYHVLDGKRVHGGA